MNPIDLLWKVLRATTNSPNDVWKPRHYERHEGIPDKLLGTAINRYTVPIKHVVKTKYGSIYLVIQFSTDLLDMPYFSISKNAFTKDLGVEKEFVYTINVRLCFDYEFKTHRKKPQDYGEIKEEYREQIIVDALGLIRNKPRSKIMIGFMEKDWYKNATKQELEQIISRTQFNNDERLYKGNKK